jgi:hypothetical protein
MGELERPIRVEWDHTTNEPFITDELLDKLKDVEIFGFVADDGRGGLELAFGPTLTDGKLVPLVAGNRKAVNDGLMQVAAASSAFKGKPCYLVTFHIKKIHMQVVGHLNNEDGPNEGDGRLPGLDIR